jgi:hypothetical protein
MRGARGQGGGHLVAVAASENLNALALHFAVDPLALVAARAYARGVGELALNGCMPGACSNAARHKLHAR